MACKASYNAMLELLMELVVELVVELVLEILLGEELALEEAETILSLIGALPKV